MYSVQSKQWHAFWQTSLFQSIHKTSWINNKKRDSALHTLNAHCTHYCSVVWGPGEKNNSNNNVNSDSPITNLNKTKELVHCRGWTIWVDLNIKGENTMPQLALQFTTSSVPELSPQVKKTRATRNSDKKSGREVVPFLQDRCCRAHSRPI